MIPTCNKVIKVRVCVQRNISLDVCKLFQNNVIKYVNPAYGSFCIRISIPILFNTKMESIYTSFVTGLTKLCLSESRNTYIYAETHNGSRRWQHHKSNNGIMENVKVNNHKLYYELQSIFHADRSQQCSTRIFRGDGLGSTPTFRHKQTNRGNDYDYDSHGSRVPRIMLFMAILLRSPLLLIIIYAYFSI